MHERDQRVADDSPLLLLSTLLGSLSDALNLRHLREHLYPGTDDFVVARATAPVGRLQEIEFTPLVRVTLPEPSSAVFGIAEHRVPPR